MPAFDVVNTFSWFKVEPGLRTCGEVLIFEKRNVIENVVFFRVGRA